MPAATAMATAFIYVIIVNGVCSHCNGYEWSKFIYTYYWVLSVAIAMVTAFCLRVYIVCL